MKCLVWSLCAIMTIKQCSTNFILLLNFKLPCLPLKVFNLSCADAVMQNGCLCPIKIVSVSYIQESLSNIANGTCSHSSS